MKSKQENAADRMKCTHAGITGQNQTEFRRQFAGLRAANGSVWIGQELFKKKAGCLKTALSTFSHNVKGPWSLIQLILAISVYYKAIKRLFSRFMQAGRGLHVNTSTAFSTLSSR